MHNDFNMMLEARMRQDEILKYASRRRLAMEARAAYKAENAGAGRFASVLYLLGSRLESAGRRLQNRYGPPPVKAY
jgi:hypothetical protein